LKWIGYFANISLSVLIAEHGLTGCSSGAIFSIRYSIATKRLRLWRKGSKNYSGFIKGALECLAMEHHILEQSK
jgi:hypothetical protein